MSKPTVGDWRRLKRIGRYLRRQMRCIIDYNFQQIVEYLPSYSDAHWALDTETSKSTGGGILTFGKHLTKSWSKTQAIVALSSAVSELINVIKSDTSNSFGYIQRHGLGELRHIDLVHPAREC